VLVAKQHRRQRTNGWFRQSAERAQKARCVKEAYFDRGWFPYSTAKIKALADAAREGGLKI